jgi:hypothetical protein
MAIAGCALAATSALADVEPNNVISQAEGPIGGGTPVNGTLSTPDDVDYYMFYAASQQQIHLTADDLTNTDDDCLGASLEDTDGESLPSSYTTPPGVNRFFVQLSVGESYCMNPLSYRIEVDPGSAITSGDPLDRLLTPTGEPNETPGQAIGPLQANRNYVGAIDTANDQDWFYFFVPPGTHQFGLSTTAPDGSCSTSVSLYGSPSSDESIQSASGGTGSFGHISQTLTGPAEYYLNAGLDSSYCVGGRWQFRIDTPDAVAPSLTTTKPKPVLRPRYLTGMTFHRRLARYSGRLSSTRGGCKVGRKVVLRRVGAGARSYGSTFSQSNGTFVIRRSRRLRGSVYAVTPQRSTSAAVCRAGRSPSIRG